MDSKTTALPEGNVTAAEILGSPEVLALLQQLQRSAPALSAILARLETLQQVGSLDGLLDLVDVLCCFQKSMTDGMVSQLADKLRVGMELMDALMISGTAEKLPALVHAVQAADADAKADTHFVKPLEVLQAPREPEMQYVLKFMLALARHLPGAMGS